MIKYALDYLNREEEGIDDLRDKLLENQVRYERKGSDGLVMLYENTSDNLEGVLSKK